MSQVAALLRPLVPPRHHNPRLGVDEKFIGTRRIERWLFGTLPSRTQLASYSKAQDLTFIVKLVSFWLALLCLPLIASHTYIQFYASRSRRTQRSSPLLGLFVALAGLVVGSGFLVLLPYEFVRRAIASVGGAAQAISLNTLIDVAQRGLENAIFAELFEALRDLF